MDLIADIGATHSRCALVDTDGLTLRISVYQNADFGGLGILLEDFIGEDDVERAALAIAGPIAGDEISMLNIDWRFDRRQMARALKLGELLVLNDFEALAHALPSR